MKNTKKSYRPIEVDDNPILKQNLKDVVFSEKLKNLFPYMFGMQWERFSNLKDFVTKFVQVDDTQQQGFKTKGVMLSTKKTASSASHQFYALLHDVLPEIEAKLKELGFLP
ncbi:MAG: hypothetical protein JWL92_571 [Candidatus Nomurabacteria bacterium]|nr:hypothetical protein [Candidatus Nomurabacteria bacterium]